MRASDPVDSLLLMRVGLYFGPACFFILTALWTKLLVEGTISTGVFVVLVVANVPITLAGIALIYGSIGGTATLLANTLTAAGDIPPPPSYPNQDVLIAQRKDGGPAAATGSRWSWRGSPSGIAGRPTERPRRGSSRS